MAKKALASENENLKMAKIKGTYAFVEWKGQTYVGYVTKLVPEYSEEIVFLEKSLVPIRKELREAALNLDKERLVLLAEDFLDLEHRLNILRKRGDTLTDLTEEQTAYIQKRRVRFKEGETEHSMVTHFYEDLEQMGPSRN